MRIRAAGTVVIVTYNSIIQLFLYKYTVPKSTYYIMLINYIIENMHCSWIQADPSPCAHSAVTQVAISFH